jgi:mRNA interferase MazF
MVTTKSNPKYTPQRGDIVWINFDPQSGKEIMKRRPALILSGEDYNKIGLALMCPITSKIKGYPFEVKISLMKKSGAVLADQVKNLDWSKRQAKFISKCSEKEMKQVLQLIATLLVG